MDTNDIFLLILGAVFLSGIFFAVGYTIRKRFAERLIRTAEPKAREILVTAKRESEETLKKADKESKQYLSKVQSEFENKVAQRSRDLENAEKVLSHKEETIDQKLEIVGKKEKEALYKLQEAASKEKTLADKEKSLEKLFSEEKEILQRISGLNPEEAKNQFLKRLEVDVRVDAGRLIKGIEDEAKDLADK